MRIRLLDCSGIRGTVNMGIMRMGRGETFSSVIVVAVIFQYHRDSPEVAAVYVLA